MLEEAATEKDEPPSAAAAKDKLCNVATTKAYKDTDFLASSSARHIRIMCELQEPMQRLANAEIDNYFLFVGSHLVMHPDERNKVIKELTDKVKLGGPHDEIEALSAKIAFAKRLQPMDKFYLVAMDLAYKVSKWNQERKARGQSTYNVCTGGGPGIMEAANRGASEAGVVSVAMGSSRPEWGHMNKYVSEEASFEFHYFFMRKFWMMYKCMGLVVLPGGYGSLDELFEVLVLVSSRKIKHRLPVIFIGKEHWRRAINWDYLLECGMLSRRDVELINFVDTADEAFEYLQSQVAEEEANDASEAVVAKRRRLCAQASKGSPGLRAAASPKLTASAPPAT